MKEPKFKIIAYHKADIVCEFTVETDGLSYLVIYGQHINGGFCAIPNHGIACEMSVPEDTYYNYEALNRSGINKNDARAIAMAIKEAANIEKERS